MTNTENRTAIVDATVHAALAGLGAIDARGAGEESRFACQVDRTADVIVARLSGDFDLAASSACQSQFAALLQSAHTCVVIDLRAVTFIDSTGIGLLVALRNRLPPHRHLRVVAGPADIHRTFEITGLTAVFAFTSPSGA